MSMRLILCTLAVISTALICLPDTDAQTFRVRGLFIPFSSYDHDPFVKESVLERMSPSRFDRGEGGTWGESFADQVAMWTSLQDPDFILNILAAYLEVFTLENPRGERREILISPVPPNKRVRIPESLLR
jgi:hypothetical protein